MKKITLIIVLAFVVTVAPVFAQQETGDLEIQIAGTYITTVGTDFSFNSGFIQAKLGKYITDNLEFGVAPNLTITKIQGQDTEVTVGGGAFFVYSLLAGDATTVPYFGGQYFKRDFEESFDNDRGSAGFTGGLKFYISEKAAFDFSGNYLFNLNEGSEGGLLLFVAGISFLL